MYEKELKQLFSKHRNEENAVPMAKYMKNHFPFLGIKTPERKILLKEFYETTNILKEQELPMKFLKKVWDFEEREYQYVVLAHLTSRPKWLTEEHLPWIENLITTKSWWDTVDTIATHIVGGLFARNQGLISQYIPKWQEHENLWLRRTAILFQLKYKEKTDVDLLFHVIRLNANHPDFFIRKAIGWALREYSKTAPETVETFIESEKLSGLSVREGMKHIKRSLKKE